MTNNYDANTLIKSIEVRSPMDYPSQAGQLKSALWGVLSDISRYDQDLFDTIMETQMCIESRMNNSTIREMDQDERLASVKRSRTNQVLADLEEKGEVG